MLKGIKKNLSENYDQIINLKRKDQLKSKEDVSVVEAFELYMLKNFHQINLNSLTTKILSFWEKDFEKSILKHKKFLEENLENQIVYNSKFSEILDEMDIFQDDNDEKEDKNQENGKDDPSNEDQNQDQEDQRDDKKDQQTQASLDLSLIHI